MAKKTPVVITAVWLRRIGDQMQVLLEMNGEWHLVISDYAEGAISWIAEGNGWLNWPVDEISKPVSEE